MIINDGRKIEQLNNIPIGECFLFEDQLYIACEEITQLPANRLCIRLRDGEPLRLASDVKCERVDAEVTYR